MSTRLDDAKRQLAVQCEVIATVIETHELAEIDAKPPQQYFEVIVESIIGQQLSVKAAATINARFRDALPEFTPDAILDLNVEEMRALGLSRSKATYILGIAEAFRSGTVDPFALDAMEDEQVIEGLTRLKGIGPWTAEMFLMFAMGRVDVWSNGDLGLRKAVWALFGEDADLDEVSNRWRPYRTYAALYLWQYVEAAPLK